MAEKKKKTAPAASPRKEFPEVMTISQLSDYLQLHKQVIYRHVKNGRIPASRIGSTLRFKKSVIDAWLEESAGAGKRKESDLGVSLNLEED